MRNFIIGLILVTLSALSTGQAQAADYFMTVFGYQGTPNLARTSHTFATFVAVENGQITEERTISWLPAEGYFGPDYSMPVLRVVPGHNYTLDQTLFFAQGHQVLYWGPYQITPALWQAAVARTNFLALGQTDYKMFVKFNEQLRLPALYNQPGGAINCIMAVSDLGGMLNTGNDWGFAASQETLGWLARWAINYPSGVRQDVAALMGLPQRLTRP